MRIAILALQGAFAEHQQTLQKMGIETFLVRNLCINESEIQILSSLCLGPTC